MECAPACVMELALDQVRITASPVLQTPKRILMDIVSAQKSGEPTIVRRIWEPVMTYVIVVPGQQLLIACSVLQMPYVMIQESASVQLTGKELYVKPGREHVQMLVNPQEMGHVLDQKTHNVANVVSTLTETAMVVAFVTATIMAALHVMYTLRHVTLYVRNVTVH